MELDGRTDVEHPLLSFLLGDPDEWTDRLDGWIKGEHPLDIFFRVTQMDRQRD